MKWYSELNTIRYSNPNRMNPNVIKRAKIIWFKFWSVIFSNIWIQFNYLSTTKNLFVSKLESQRWELKSTEEHQISTQKRTKIYDKERYKRKEASQSYLNIGHKNLSFDRHWKKLLFFSIQNFFTSERWLSRTTEIRKLETYGDALDQWCILKSEEPDRRPSDHE